VAIDWLSRAKWLDGTALEWVTSVPRKKVHVQVRQRVAMYLIVELDGTRYSTQGRRNAMCVLHERYRLSNGKVVQVNRVHARDQANASDHWRAF
jgi:hypothetical protein